MYRLRNARPSDRPGLLELARILNTLNLPPDEAVIHDLLTQAQRAFASPADPAAFDPLHHWTFVLEDPAGQVVGTSGLHAQHGTPTSPHTFFRVLQEQRCTPLGPQAEGELHLHHRVLQLERSFDGPTEVGGLVLSPASRGLPGKLGTLLSLGRFLFVACRRGLFRPQMLAEVLPPLEHDAQGEPTSPLWDALGARFTGLSYNEADKLSRTHLDLIPRLFPESRIYTCLLSQAAQAVIGQVGAPSKGAAHLLHKVGFRPSAEIDPFDGGPHYYAQTDELAPLVQGRWSEVRCGDVQGGFALVACDDPASGRFRAVRTEVEQRGATTVLSREAWEALECSSSAQRVWVWPEPARADS